MKKSKKHDLRKQLDTIVYPQTNHTIVYQVAHGLPPWKIVWMMFFNWVLIRYHIFWKIDHFWEFQMKEIKKGINWKENTLASKKKVKEIIEKNQKKHNLRKQLDTIVYPQTNHTIVYQGCSWTTPLKNYLNDVF